MKKQHEPDSKPTLLTLIVWIVICLGILTWLAIYFFSDKEPIMPESVKQEWITEKDREDATKEYFTEIQKHLEVSFVDKQTVQIKWKTWEMGRKKYDSDYPSLYIIGNKAYYMEENCTIDTVMMELQ